jgi:DNA (cytosine-5)-methyltransferase 1
MRHGSLFTGIGGFDLAAEKVGWENVFAVEIDPFCRDIYTKRFKGTKLYDDIRNFDGSQYRGSIDIISGGFPCQPFSYAGEQKGSADDRALWTEMFRVIREIHPKFIVGENVAGIIDMELDNVLTDLESIDYSCQTFNIPACSVGAIHQRERIWIIAQREV